MIMIGRNTAMMFGDSHNVGFGLYFCFGELKVEVWGVMVVARGVTAVFYIELSVVHFASISTTAGTISQYPTISTLP